MLVTKCYPHGQLFIILFPDGTGNVLYPLSVVNPESRKNHIRSCFLDLHSRRNSMQDIKGSSSQELSSQAYPATLGWKGHCYFEKGSQSTLSWEGRGSQKRVRS